jgi:hypothetical protein
MTGVLPTRQEARQLRELRGLRVTRARKRHADACSEAAAAQAAVRQREHAIAADLAAIADLAGAAVTSLAPHLPRWHGVLQARHALLAEQLERDEDALIGEARRLDQAQAAADQAKIELARALAREDVARDLAREADQAGAAAVERRAEVELEDQRPVSASRGETSAATGMPARRSC